MAAARSVWLLAFVCTPALADVVVTSRESSIRAFAQEHMFDRILYDENESFSGLGTWDAALAHAPRHHEWASMDAPGTFYAGGSFYAVHRTDNNTRVDRLSNVQMEARFDVTGSPAAASLSYSGNAYLHLPGMTQANVAIELVRLDAPTTVFELMRDGSPIYHSGQWVEWSQGVWNGELAPGSYRLTVRALVFHMDALSGSISEGAGTLNFGMSIVPAPASGLAGGAAMVFAVVRRRRR